jgi:hypothetical protein
VIEACAVINIGDAADVAAAGERAQLDRIGQAELHMKLTGLPAEGRLEPLIPEASSGGRPLKTDMRAAMNATLYLLRTGCPWRYLSRDSFPPRSTVYNIFRKFRFR